MVRAKNLIILDEGASPESALQTRSKESSVTSIVKKLLLAAFACGAAVQASAAPADGSPSQPVRLVVPYSAGGLADLTARILAEQLAIRLGQGVLVENRPGANGTIGAAVVAKAPADGTTLGVVVSSHAFSKSLMPDLPFDPIKDFAPVTLAVRSAMVLVATPGLPASNVPELITYAKAHPNEVAFASAGNGSNVHLFGQWFADRAGLQMIHVPYKGSAAAHVDLMAGRTQIAFDTYGAVQQHLKAGRLKLLASGAGRLPQYPNVPSVAEAGFPGFRAESWVAIIAPLKTPPAVIATFNREIAAVLNMPAVRQKLEDAGGTIVGSSPDELAKLMVADAKKYGDLISSMGIKLN